MDYSAMYMFDPATGTGVIFMTNGSKQSFAYGETSFYQVEEAVFSAAGDR